MAKGQSAGGCFFSSVRRKRFCFSTASPLLWYIVGERGAAYSCFLTKQTGGSRKSRPEGLLQNRLNKKNEIDFPERGCLSHFLL